MKDKSKKCLSVARLEELTEGAEQDYHEKQHINSCASCKRNLKSMAQAEELLKSLHHDIKHNYGLSFGPYHSCHRLTEGGMSVIYSALDSKGQAVIVKVCRAPKLIPYFREEVNLLQKCAASEISGVIKLIDHDLEHYPAYMVFPFITGGSIATYLDESVAMPPSQLAHVCCNLARTLAGFEGNGIIHGSIKPANLLLISDHDVTFSSLGSSREVLVDKRDYSEETKSSPVSHCTVAYMSPEQVYGDELSIHSDIFSIGTILYELAVDKHPFFNDSICKLSSNILSGGIDELPPEIPKGMASFIYSCLAKDPELRPNGMQLSELTQELLLGDEELILGSSSPDGITIAKKKGSGTLFMILFIITAAIACGAFFAWKKGLMPL